VREDRRSFGEEITPVVTGPVSGANDEDEDEDWEDEEEEGQQESTKKKRKTKRMTKRKTSRCGLSLRRAEFCQGYLVQFMSRSIATHDADQVFTSREVSRIAKISRRQLQWWDERKLISPRQEGHKRVYLPEQLIASMVVAELRRNGLPLQKMRRLMRFLRRQMPPRLQQHLSSPADGLYLLTDGKSTHLESAPGRIIDLLKNSRQAMWLISVSDQVQRLTGKIPLAGSGDEHVSGAE